MGIYDGADHGLAELVRRLESYKRAGKKLTFKREILEAAIKTESPLNEVLDFGAQDPVVPAEHLLSFFYMLVSQQKLFKKVFDVDYDPDFLSGDKRPLTKKIESVFGVPIRTELRHVDISSLVLLEYTQIFNERGEQAMTSVRVLPRADLNIGRYYFDDKTAFRLLEEELKRTRLKTDHGDLSYFDVLKTAVLLDRQRVLYDGYVNVLKVAVGGELDQHLRKRALAFFLDIVELNPSFFSFGAVHNPGNKSEVLKMIEEYGSLRKVSPEVIDAKGRIIERILEVCIRDFRERPYMSIPEFTEMAFGDCSETAEARVLRMLKYHEISIKDVGPIIQLVNLLDRSKQSLGGNTTHEKYSLLSQLDDLYLTNLSTNGIGNVDYVVTQDALKSFIESSILIGEQESLKILFGLRKLPNVITNQSGSLADFLSKRSKAYSGKAVYVFAPFDIEQKGVKHQGYVPSDLRVDQETRSATLPRQLIDAGSYSPIKLELLLRDIVSDKNTMQNGYYTLEQVASQLGCKAGAAENLLREAGIKKVKLALLEAHRRLVEDPLVSGFRQFDEVASFYTRHNRTFSDIVPAVESFSMYDSKEIERLKKDLFVSSDEFGRQLGLDMPFDIQTFEEAVKDVSSKKKPHLNRFCIDGRTAYYRPETDNFVRAVKQDKTFYKIILYHQLKNAFAGER